MFLNKKFGYVSNEFYMDISFHTDVIILIGIKPAIIPSNILALFKYTAQTELFSKLFSKLFPRKLQCKILTMIVT